MMKKQKMMHWATVVALVVLSSLSGAYAQSQPKKSAASREAKVIIMQKENQEYLMLDTTLVLAPGETAEEVVKQLKLKGNDLRSLAAKPITPSTIDKATNLDYIRVFPARVTDSARATTYRSFHADSARTIVFSIAGADSSRVLKCRDAMSDSTFSKLQKHRISLKGATSLKGIPAGAIESITVDGQQILLRHSSKDDSLPRKRIIIRLDSTSHFHPDSFMTRERIEIRKDGTTGDVKVFRLDKEGAEGVLEQGAYEVLKLQDDANVRVILLRQNKRSTETNSEKKEGKIASKKETKIASPLVVQVYPNPTSGHVSLVFEVKKKADVKIRIVDNQGKTVFQDERESYKGVYRQEVNLAKYGKGMFVIQLMVGKHLHEEKVLVQ